MLTEKQVRAGTLTVNYAEGPPGGSPLVLLHGLSYRWQSWLGVMPHLALRWHLYALDLRGFGRSGRAPGAYRVRDYAADVAALLREVIQAPAVLVGHSLGAVVAISVAADAPDLVRAAVLEEPPLGVFTDQPLADTPQYGAYRAMYELSLQRRPLEETAAAIGRGLPGVDAVELRSRAAALLQRDPEALAFMLDGRVREGFDVAAALERIACPVLLVQGDPALGGALTDDRAARACARLRRCTHIALPNAGHFIHHAVPGDFARLVTDYLETL